MFGKPIGSPCKKKCCILSIIGPLSLWKTWRTVLVENDSCRYCLLSRYNDTMLVYLTYYFSGLSSWMGHHHHHHHHHHHTSSILRSETSPSRNYKTWKPVPGRFFSPRTSGWKVETCREKRPPRYPTVPNLDGGNSNIFACSSLLGEDEPIWTSIFFKWGWFNHQQYPTLVSFRDRMIHFLWRSSVRCSWIQLWKHVELHNYKHMICRFAGIAQLHHFVVQIQSNLTTKWGEFALWMTWIAYKSHRIRGL